MHTAAYRQSFLSDFTELSQPQGPRPAPSRPAPWEAEVERFLEWKQSETSVGEAWISRMRWELLRFPRLLKSLGATVVATCASEVSLDQVLTLRNGLAWEKATFALHFAALRQFLAWAGNPVATHKGAWRLPSGQPTHRRWLTKEQLLRLYDASNGRSRLLVGLEGLNGLRRVEVLRLRAKDVTLDEGCLRVLGKGKHGGKWRKIPVHPQLRELLQETIVRLAPQDRLVPGSRSTADHLLRAAAEAAGLGREGVRVSHHDLRRTFGRLAHEAGMDLVEIKNMLGHSSVEMSGHYIGLDTARMEEGLGRLAAFLGRWPPQTPEFADDRGPQG